MIPLFPNNMTASGLNVPLYYQAYNNIANYNALSSMLMISQEQALRSQLIAISQMKAQLLQNALKAQLTHPKIEFRRDESLSLETSSSDSPTQNSTPAEEPVKSVVAPKEQSVTSKNKANKKEISNLPFVKAQLEEMVHFLLNNLGKLDQAEIEKARRRYAPNPYLIPVFDILVAKYSPVKKHREDIVRYVIRKALKFVKKDVIEQNKVYGKKAYAVLCKKYFQVKANELETSGINIEDEKELIEFLLPYRKNSKNRTMNTNFTAEIFSSQEFCEDYKRFLGVFEDMIDADNKEKIQKLIVLAEECIVKNCPEKIKKCTRLPWLQVWVEKTRNIAFGLLNEGKLENEEKLEKKVKTEPLVSEIMVKSEGN